MANTQSLAEKDRAFVWHPFTQMQTAPLSIPIVRAEGVYLYTEEGKRYLDAISSWWVNLHGHAHPYIAEKICTQLAILPHVLFAGFTHSPAVELAERLVAILPGKMSKIFYSDNGSTAVETALKMAFQYWHNQNTPKRKVICLKGSYHGETFGAMSASGKNQIHKPFWSHLFEVEAVDPSFDAEEVLLKLLEKQDVACFIFEPLVLGVGGMRIYPPEVLDLFLKHCRVKGVLTIADEVMTGFGRTGPLFACEKLKETPDMIALSKGLTGGFLPLGVTACSEKIYSAFLSDHLSSAFLHGHSYTANPLACASALGSLDLLLTDACTKQRERIAQAHKEFCQRWDGYPKLKRCESLGTLLVLEYKTEESSYFDKRGEKLYSFFLKEKILLRPLGNVLYLLPPYCIKPQELEFIYERIEQTLCN